jgi:hypothetical protein
MIEQTYNSTIWVLRFMKIRLSFVHQIIMLAFFLILICSFSESAGSEPIKPDNASAPVQAEAHNRSIANKPDLRPS